MKFGCTLTHFVVSSSVLTSIVTQGRHDSAEWVETYYVTYSLNGANFVSEIREKMMVLCME